MNTDAVASACTWPPVPAPGERWLLILDFDGTLVSLAAHPDACEPVPGLEGLLTRVAARLGGGLVILSGRTRAQLRRHLPGLPDAMLVGCHGHDHAEAGLPPASLQRARHWLAERVGNLHGVWIEDKGHGFSVHYRQAPEMAERVLRAASRAIAPHADLRALSGNHVVDVLPGDCSKGRAVAGLKRRLPDHCPVMVGDDVSDEEAFCAALALGGFGVRVGPARKTSARYRIPCVPLVHEWLERLAGKD